METLNVSLSMQETPVDLSINRSSRLVRHPIPFPDTMVVPNPGHFSSSSKFQSTDHFPHLRFHSNVHSPSETEIVQTQCNEIDVCGINNVSPRICTSTEDLCHSLQNYQQLPKREEVLDTKFPYLKGEKHKMNSTETSKSTVLPLHFTPESSRSSHKRKFIKETSNDSKTVRKKQKLCNTTDSAGAAYGKFPYDYFCNYFRSSSDHVSNVDPFHAGLDAIYNPSGAQLHVQPSSQETESLLAAVQHSQMLYYSYCNQLFQKKGKINLTVEVNSRKRILT